jgi:hypothetical protein
VPPAWRTRLLWLTGILALILGLTLSVADLRLRTSAAPRGMVNLQLAHNQPHAAAIIQSWKDKHPPPLQVDTMEGIVQPIPDGVDKLAVDLLLADFAFILLYSLALSMLTVWLPLDSRTAAIGSLLGYLIWVGALSDALENTLLLRMLNGEINADNVSLIRLVAGIKFLLFLASLGFAAWLLWQRGRRAGAAVLACLWGAVAFTVLAALLG